MPSGCSSRFSGGGTFTASGYNTTSLAGQMGIGTAREPDSACKGDPAA